MISVDTKHMQCPLCLTKGVTALLKGGKDQRDERKYYQCPCCALIFVSSEFHLSPQEEKRRYELHENDPRDTGYLRFLSKLTDPLKDRLNPGMRGLDFGCGPGPAIASLLQELHVEVDNYDPYFFPDDNLVHKSYDFITCTEVAEHLAAPRKEFQLFDQLLTEKRGLIALMTELYSQENDFLSWWYINEPTHICFYTKRTLEWVGSWMGWKTDFPHPNVVIYEK